MMVYLMMMSDVVFFAINIYIYILGNIGGESHSQPTSTRDDRVLNTAHFP